MKANEMHTFSDLFDKVLYMFPTGPLSIIRSISTMYTCNRYLSCWLCWLYAGVVIIKILNKSLDPNCRKCFVFVGHLLFGLIIVKLPVLIIVKIPLWFKCTTWHLWYILMFRQACYLYCHILHSRWRWEQQAHLNHYQQNHIRQHHIP